MSCITKYDPKFINKVDEYIQLRQDEHYEFHKNRGDKSNSFEERIKAQLPTIEDFADYIHVSRKSLYNWEKEYPEFGEALEKIKNEQLKRVLNGGLDGSYNPTIARLVLSTNHGFRDGIDTTSGGAPLNTFNDEQIDKIADRIATRKGGDGNSSSSKELD